MRRTTYILKSIVVATAFLAGVVSAFAQKQDSPSAEENMLRYRYIDRANRKINFSAPRTFSERIYIYAGTGIEGLYQLGNHPESPGYAIGSRMGMGFWATPLHGVEASLSYGMMPYGYWGKNFLGDPVIDNTIIRNFGFEANYVFNITNHTNHHDRLNTFDILYKAGVNLGAGDKFLYGINTSVKAIYNIGSHAGLYIEPKVNFMNFEYVRPSISAGFVFRFMSADKGF